MRKSSARAAFAVFAAIALAVAIGSTHLHRAAAADASRLQGSNRYETAVAISKTGFPSGASVAYLARGDGFADALAAGALTGGPILLVPPDGNVPSAVSAEVQRLNPQTVIALGSTGAVPDSTLASLGQGRTTRRLAGPTRYETAAAISQYGFPNGAPVAYLARGDGFADALAAGALTGGPILLVPSEGNIPSAVGGEVNRLNPQTVIALGSTGAVPESTLTALGTGRNTRRLAGPTRYDTAVAISKDGFPSGAGVAYLSRGDGFADALAAGALTGGPIVLVPSDGSIPGVVRDEVARLNPQRVIALGGTSAVPESTLNSLASPSSSGGGSPTTATTAAGGSPGTTTLPADAFVENFVYSGEHAATLAPGGTTVWWNRDLWDVRGDTHNNAVVPGGQYPDGTPYPWQGFHADIHKAVSPADTDQREQNSSGVPGGDGSPGLGVMHLDFQGIVSARLRNPMLISAARPGVVTFYAPKFVTTGHWWEVAITPTTAVSAAEYSAVPGRQDGESLDSPLSGVADGGNTNGPGHHQFLSDAINVISTGWPDAPTCDDSGWHARYALTRAAGTHVENHVNGKGDIANLLTVDPADRALVHWRLTYKPDSVQLESDFNDDNVWDVRDKWPVQVPWNEVYVHLLYVSYQADHHPQVGCGYDQNGNGVTQVQETQWREVVVAPVKYKQTFSLPETTPARRSAGWMSFDLRDIQRRGTAGSLPQPNAGPYDKYDTYAWCSKFEPGILCGDQARATQDVTLDVDVPAASLAGINRAQFVADVRYSGSVDLTVNGTTVGRLPAVPETTPPSPSGSEFEPEAWVRRSINVNPQLLHAGKNTLHLLLSGDRLVAVDRAELELSL